MVRALHPSPVDQARLEPSAIFVCESRPPLGIKVSPGDTHSLMFVQPFTASLLEEQKTQFPTALVAV